MHSLCFHIRLWEEDIRSADRPSEAFDGRADSADAGRRARSLLVVTGGFHSSALAARQRASLAPASGADAEEQDGDEGRIEQAGIAPTTYSYERLDNLTGYDAGMPSPGFYEHAWRQRQGGGRFRTSPC